MDHDLRRHRLLLGLPFLTRVVNNVWNRSAQLLVFDCRKRDLRRVHPSKEDIPLAIGKLPAEDVQKVEDVRQEAWLGFKVVREGASDALRTHGAPAAGVEAPTGCEAPWALRVPRYLRATPRASVLALAVALAYVAVGPARSVAAVPVLADGQKGLERHDEGRLLGVGPHYERKATNYKLEDLARQGYRAWLLAPRAEARQLFFCRLLIQLACRGFLMTLNDFGFMLHPTFASQKLGPMELTDLALLHVQCSLG
ncbi:hypothetical protein FIBSPDRAFT_886341 [Athelia psychrophila]|uniref:Uncharacterized protein n=1 Tax=Athelia psychrophila TaxID=1759441 RepID=A0A166R1D3_9AGAM|nr:hypothetical protein FIBSPDRAFT_886341 [Fibularhizoctonia sp. CBS 109695]